MKHMFTIYNTNKQTTVRPSDPPWITLHLKLQIRRRRRAYRKAKRTNNAADWTKIRSLRNRYIQKLAAETLNADLQTISRLVASENQPLKKNL
jgi:hypothetical protein